MNVQNTRTGAILAGLLLLAGLPQARAGYGLTPPAQGAQSAGYANAALAVTNDTDAININPAGLSRIQASRADAMIEPAYWLVTHEDDIGGSAHPDNRVIAIAAGGYARRLDPQWVLGLGLSVQGGAGFAYEDLPNAFGAPDDVSALFGSFKVSPALSWQISERLALGLSVGLVYSSARQKLLPNTAIDGFTGFRLDGLEGFSTNARIGLLFDLNPQWTFAAAYATKTPVRLKGGSMTFARTAPEQPRLVYEDVALKGLNFAAEASLGLAFRPQARWLLSANISFYDWSSAMRATRLQATKPSDPAAPDLDIPSPLDFRDQYVTCLGASYRWSDNTELRAGLGYGRNPQGAVSLSPALNLVANRTVATGISHRFNGGWEFNGAVLLQPPNGMHYESPIYGGPAKEAFGALAVYLDISRSW